MRTKTILEENDLALCTIKRLEGTTVFLEIEGNGEGTMIFSEVSAGRIRNIRDFIIINKKIVCKVLRIKGENIELSLRRVSGKERDEVLDKYKKERVLISILKPILKEKTPQILEKIKLQYELADFLDEARENPKLIEKFVPKSEIEQLKKILTEKKEKEKIATKNITLKSQSESGIKDIKEVLTTNKAEIRYLGSGKFSISTKAKEYKIANHSLEKIINEIKESAKKLHVQLEIKEK